MRLERKNFDFDRATGSAVKFLDRKIRVSRMALDSGVHRRTAASVTWTTEIKAQRHLRPSHLLMVRLCFATVERFVRLRTRSDLNQPSPLLGQCRVWMMRVPFRR